MPYITTEQVKAVREELKREFPNVKFSVTREHYSTINICIMESPFDWDFRNDSNQSKEVNCFYLETYENSEFLVRVKRIANRGNRTVSEDGDYGSIPAFYLNIKIGKWDKPHKKIEPKVKEESKDLDFTSHEVERIGRFCFETFARDRVYYKFKAQDKESEKELENFLRETVTAKFNSDPEYRKGIFALHKVDYQQREVLFNDFRIMAENWFNAKNQFLPKMKLMK